MKKIKICHISNLISGRADGVFTHLLMLIKGINGERFEHYLVYQGSDEVLERLKFFNVKLISLPSLNKKFSFIIFIELYRILKKEKIDIIHSHMIKAYTIAGLLNIFLRKKFIFNYHGSFIKDGNYNFPSKLVYLFSHYLIQTFRSCHLTVTPSEVSKKALLSESRMFRKIKIYVNGGDFNSKYSTQIYDLNLFCKIADLKKRNKIIAVVARLEEQKRIDISIEIVKNLLIENKNINLLIFGEGSKMKVYKNLITKYNLEENVILCGYHNISKFYLLFDLLLITSDWEALPIAGLEALYFGIPIVSTDVGGVSRILIEENCGMVFPRGDIDAGCKSIKRLFSDPILYQLFSENGKKAVNEKYNYAEFAKRFYEFYNDLLSGKE